MQCFAFVSFILHGHKERVCVAAYARALRSGPDEKMRATGRRTGRKSIFVWSELIYYGEVKETRSEKNRQRLVNKATALSPR